MSSETVLRRYLQEFGRHAQEFSIALDTEYVKNLLGQRRLLCTELEAQAFRAFTYVVSCGLACETRPGTMRGLQSLAGNAFQANQ